MKRSETKRALKAVSLMLCMLGLLLLAACEEDVTAVRTERPFAAYGLLSPLYPKQEVYVFPVEERLRPLPPEPLDARVTTTDLVTGETVVWRDSVVAAADEGAAHLFWAPAPGRLRPRLPPGDRALGRGEGSGRGGCA